MNKERTNIYISEINKKNIQDIVEEECIGIRIGTVVDVAISHMIDSIENGSTTFIESFSKHQEKIKKASKGE